MSTDFGPLPFLVGHRAEPVVQHNIILYYHQAAFQLLDERFGERIAQALVTAPQAVRTRYLAKRLPMDQELTAELAWPAFRELLEVLEAEIAAVLRGRSVAFWMHIYRRIGVRLHPHHEAKTDPQTVRLVREIVELAITKHGRAEDAGEIVLSSRVKPELILGGFMRAGLKKMFKKRFSKIYREFVKSLRASPQWVIKDFTEQDWINIYHVEGLAYQYWRSTAHLRGLGKGDRITVRSDGRLASAKNDELHLLMDSYDRRIDNEQIAGSLLGVWFDVDIAAQNAPQYIPCPVYNVYNKTPAMIFRRFGLNVGEDFVSNFLPAFFDVNGYLEAHGFISDTFERAQGYRLEAFVATLWALAYGLFLSGQVSTGAAKAFRIEKFRNSFLSVMQRGYGVAEIDSDKGVFILLTLINHAFPRFNVAEADVRAVLDRLTLTPASQAAISLWSGGPRYVCIPCAGSQRAVDLQGLSPILGTLFVRVAHDQAQRGAIFEEAFRRALVRRGFEVRSGELIAFDGITKELDAGVIINGDLVVFECVSVERPLDYEIGRPATLNWRRERLEEKVTQVLQLSKFLEGNLRGRNYNFPGVRRIKPLVVSPFVEWLWDRSERLWLPDGTPRILSASEALDLIERAREDRKIDR